MSNAKATSRFWTRLQALHEQAGRPTLERMVRLGTEQRPPITISVQTINDWLRGKSVPTGSKSVRYFQVLVSWLNQLARKQHGTVQIVPLATWEAMLAEAQRERAENRGGRPPARAQPGPVHIGPDPVAFTGRTGAVTELLHRLAPTAQRGAVVVAGMPGVGKTALVTHVAHRVREQGWFPGGIVLAELHGYSTSDPVDDGTTAAYLLRAFGVPDAEVPALARERVMAWGDLLIRLADEQRQVLLVLDNVATAGQVSALLPGPPHAALITSRNTLSVLAAYRMEVAPLTPDESVDVLDCALRIAYPGDDRATRDEPDARTLVGLCGQLPLAIRIVGALLRDERGRRLSDQVAELADARGRLERLHYDDQDEHGRPLAVRAAFDLSYDRLSTEHARAFRLFAVNPGTDASTRTVAALLDREPPEARRLLADLARLHLIESRPDDRWGMHDLLRLYADEHGDRCAQADGRTEAFDRLITCYLTVLSQADLWLRSFDTGRLTRPNEFGSREQALAWLDLEYRNVTAAVAATSDTARWKQTLQLVHGLRDYLEFRHHADEAIGAATLGLAAARHLDQRSRCQALGLMGSAYQLAHRYQEAVDHHRQALEIAVRIEDRLLEGPIQHNLGLALHRLERFAEAERCHRRDWEICDAEADWRGAGQAMIALADALRGSREFRRAIDILNRAIALFDKRGDVRNLLMARTNMALACLDGMPTRAAYIIWQFCQALKAARDIDHHYSQALLFLNLSAAYLNRCRGCHGPAAVEWAQRAAIRFGDLRDDLRQGNAWLNVAQAQCHTGQFADARRNASHAAEIFDLIGASEWAESARSLLAAMSDGSVPPHTGCPSGGAQGPAIRAWLDDLPHAVLRGEDQRLDEYRFVGTKMMGPFPSSSPIPDELLRLNASGLATPGSDVTTDEAIGLLRAQTRLDEDSASWLTAVVGRYPDALALAAAIIRRKRLTCAELIQRLDVLPLDSTEDQHPATATRMAGVAIDLVDEDRPNTRPLLELAALLSPWPRRDQDRAAVDALTDTSLLTIDGQRALVMSDPVRRVLRLRMRRDGTLLATAEVAVRMLAEEVSASLPPLYVHGLEVPASQELARRINALWLAVAPEVSSDWPALEDMMRLRGWAVVRLAAVVAETTVLNVAAVLVDDCTRLLGDDHPSTWHARNQRAEVLGAQGQYDEACGLLARNLRREMSTLDTLLAKHDLAVMQARAGRVTRAIRMLLAVLDEQERILGAAHPATVATKRSLAVVHGAAGNLVEAIGILEPMLRSGIAAAEPDEFEILHTQDALATVYPQAERRAEAIALRRDALTRARRYFPSDSPELVTVRNALANALLQAEHWPEAMRLLKRNLAILERTRGTEDPVTAIARTNLIRAQDFADRAGA